MTWQSKLLAWYRAHRRDLPWRRTKDPYAVWISEVMLQQTTVETVIPYYERFLRRFPTAGALAKAEVEDVLKLWSGLGYYSRARNLHKAAEMICSAAGANTRFVPTLPDTVDELMELPGIGRYTAGAIASIAFGKRAPVVDGNVIRVLSRIFSISANPKSTAGQKVFWHKAEEILPKESERRKVPFRTEQSGNRISDGGFGGRAVSPPDYYGDFNQALMELGATVCSPENPTCRACPVSEDCRVYKEARPEDFPRPKKKIEYRNVTVSAAVIRRKGRVLFLRRPDTGLLKGLWELPMVEGDAQALEKRWAVKTLRPLPAVRHSVLNRRLKIAPFLCVFTKKNGVPEGVPASERRWLAISEASALPTSSMNLKILRHVGD